jgi:hypothetical protein
LEKIFSADRRLGFAPVRFVWGNNRQARKSEVRHRARGRSNIERIARRDEHHLESIALAS